MMRALIRTVLLFGFAAGTASAWAQATNQWYTNCEIDKMTDIRLCIVSFAIRLPSGKAGPSISFGLIPGRHDQFSIISALRPGVERARIRVDSNPLFVLDQCKQYICRLALPQVQPLLGQMRQGVRMFVDMTHGGSTDGPWETTLSGFDRQYQKAKQVSQ